MSDFLETDDDDLDEPTVTLSQADAKAQRALARKGEKFDGAVAERDAAQRELAFLKAGVNPDSAVGKLFVKGYDGELTKEAITAAAADIPDLIVTAEAPAEQTEQLTPEQEAAAKAEAEQTQQRQQLASGNTNAGTAPPRDPRELMVEAVDNARKAGRSEDRALAEGFRELVNAAANGDERVRIKGFGNS